MNQQRNYFIDILRGFASIWVVIFHLNEVIPYEANFYTSFAKYGWLGVPIFFIISGYCINMVTQKNQGPLKFMIRRFFRIYPPYLASIFVVLAVIAIRKIYTGYNDVTILPQTYYEIGATILLLTKPASDVGTINWVYWSLTYEVVFYLLIFISIIRFKFKTQFIILITALTLSGNVLSHNNFLFFLDQWCLFSLGIGLYEYLHKSKTAGIIMSLMSIISVLIYNDTAAILAATTGAILILISESYTIKYREKPSFLSKIGEFSYSLYLIHVPIGCYLLLGMREGIWLESLPLHILYDLSVVAILLLISWVFFLTIEVPAIKLGRNLTHRLETDPLVINLYYKKVLKDGNKVLQKSRFKS